MMLVIVGVVSLIGVIFYWYWGNVNFFKVLIFGLVIMVGVFGGVKLVVFFLVIEMF